MGIQEGLEAAEGETEGGSALHHQSLGNVQKEGRGLRAHGEGIKEEMSGCACLQMYFPLGSELWQRMF